MSHIMSYEDKIKVGTEVILLDPMGGYRDFAHGTVKGIDAIIGCDRNRYIVEVKRLRDANSTYTFNGDQIIPVRIDDNAVDKNNKVLKYCIGDEVILSSKSDYGSGMGFINGFDLGDIFAPYQIEIHDEDGCAYEDTWESEEHIFPAYESDDDVKFENYDVVEVIENSTITAFLHIHGSFYSLRRKHGSSWETYKFVTFNCAEDMLCSSDYIVRVFRFNGNDFRLDDVEGLNRDGALELDNHSCVYAHKTTTHVFLPSDLKTGMAFILNSNKYLVVGDYAVNTTTSMLMLLTNVSHSDITKVYVPDEDEPLEGEMFNAKVGKDAEFDGFNLLWSREGGYVL